jgi:hypothetical protein
MLNKSLCIKRSQGYIIALTYPYVLIPTLLFNWARSYTKDGWIESKPESFDPSSFEQPCSFEFPKLSGHEPRFVTFDRPPRSPETPDTWFSSYPWFRYLQHWPTKSPNQPKLWRRRGNERRRRGAERRPFLREPVLVEGRSFFFYPSLPPRVPHQGPWL